MIERGFIQQKTKEFYIKDYIESRLRGAEISQIKLKKIPLGEKIIVKTSRPGLIVGSKGSTIRALTKYLKKNFELENPQIEIVEVKDLFLDPNIVAKRIAGSLERFGSARFKGVGHKTMSNVLSAGALGVEIKISGKIPGARAKSWRFYQGYLKKCGDVSISGVRTAYASALLKSGIIGIQVRIMPPNLILPDHVEILDEPVQIVEEENLDEKKTKKKSTKAKTTKKKVAPKRKKVAKKEGPKVEDNKEEVKEDKAQEPTVEESKEKEVEAETKTTEEAKEVEQKEEVKEENNENQ